MNEQWERWQKRKQQTPINDPINPEVDACFAISLAGDYQGLADEYTRAELNEYNRDPDLFAAKHFGFVSAEEYREFVRSDFRALCSERLKRGPMCGGEVPVPREERAYEYGLDWSDQRIDVWRKFHRIYPCKYHESLLARAREAKK